MPASPRKPHLQLKDLARLDRILALLASDNAGERASAARAAAEFVKKHDLTWREVIDGGAAQSTAAPRHRAELGVDYLAAAQSRIRQLQAHNIRLEAQVRRLKARLKASEDENADR